MMTGGDETPTSPGPTGPSRPPGPAPPSQVTFTIPTDDTSLNECYGARYTDLRAAFGTNNGAYGSHWTNHGIGEGRDRSCTITDEQAQCYLDRYPDAKAYAGTDLKKARKHYYETGLAQHKDFVCGPTVKELACYVRRYPDLQTAFGTNYEIGNEWNQTLYQAYQHWHSNGLTEGRDYSCP